MIHRAAVDESDHDKGGGQRTVARAVATLVFRSRRYRSGFTAATVSLEIEADDPAALHGAALNYGRSRIGQLMAALVPCKKPKVKQAFYDGETGETFQGNYPGSGTTVRLFRVYEVEVSAMQVRGEQLENSSGCCSH